MKSIEAQRGALVGSLRRSETRDPELEEVDRLIERRPAEKSPRDAANEREAIWKEGERRHNAELEEMYRHMWIAHYKRLSRAHAGISEHFEGKAAQLEAGDAA